jgi:hypothetical protein
LIKKNKKITTSLTLFSVGFELCQLTTFDLFLSDFGLLMVDNQQSNTRFRRDAYAFCSLTIENLRRLNFEQKANEVQTRTRLDELIDKQTTDYLKSLDKKTRTQLSKTQLVKSHQKVHQWKQKNRFDPYLINIFFILP